MEIQKQTEEIRITDTERTPAPEPADRTPADYEAQLTRLREEHAAELEKVRIDGEVRYTLAKMGARNPELAARALDLSGVQVEKGTVTGVEGSVKRLMETDPYLFGSAGVLPPTGGEGSTGGVHGSMGKDPESMSDGEYYRMIGVPGRR